MQPNPLTAVHWLIPFFLAALALGGCAAAAPASPAASAAAATDSSDPPGRVGRLAWVSGAVDLVTDGETQAAELNWPITSGQTLLTGPSGRAEVRIGSLTVRLDGESELKLARIDDAAVQLFLARGAAVLTARNRDWLQNVDLTTARARIELLAPGRYRIEAGPDRTQVGSPDGQARILANRMNFSVHAGESGQFSGEPYPSFRRLAFRPDSLDEWAAARDRHDERAASQRYVSPEMPGAETLDDYGRWQSVETMGAVWFPTQVANDWAPYRVGRWVWINPWGWSWVDAAPWGFAPFHYGRWVLIGGRWGWVPGGWIARPAYAPALVAWNTAPGLNASAGAPVGWFPLAPGEVFLPWYRNSRPYLNHINAGHATHQPPAAAITPPRYRYRDTPGATTWVPGRDFGREPPQRVVMPAPPPPNIRPTLPPALPTGEGYKRIPRPLPIPQEDKRRPSVELRPAPSPAVPAGSRPAAPELGRPTTQFPGAPAPQRPNLPQGEVPRPVTPRIEHRPDRPYGEAPRVEHPGPREDVRHRAPSAPASPRIEPPLAPRAGTPPAEVRAPEPREHKPARDGKADADRGKPGEPLMRRQMQ